MGEAKADAKQMVEVRVPAVGESITEGVVSEWFHRPGDVVKVDEPLFALETDKITVDVPSPASGVLREVLVEEGDTVQINQVVARIEEGAEPAGASAERAEPAQTTPTATSGSAPEPAAPAAGAQPSASATAAPAEPAASRPSEQAQARPAAPPSLGPAVRQALREHGLDAAEAQRIEGSGPHGRITPADVARHAAALRAQPQPTAPPGAAGAAPEEATGRAQRTERRVKMTPLRKRVAERLVEARQTTAMLTTFNECDLSELLAVRARYKEAFLETHGVKLGIMSFFVKAAVDALKTFPIVNAHIEGDEIVYCDYQDIGIAVGGGKGLVVPVLRDADRMSFAEIEKAIADFAERARRNRLTLEELQGGTFTISNGGVYGSLNSTPLLNPPQSAILGMHAIKKRPVVRGDEIVARPMMYLALSYDHRIIDGREAVSFLRRIVECVEDPVRMLIEV